MAESSHQSFNPDSVFSDWQNHIQIDFRKFDLQQLQTLIERANNHLQRNHEAEDGDDDNDLGSDFMDEVLIGVQQKSIESGEIITGDPDWWIKRRNARE